MSDDWDPSKLCRDEECEIEEAHRAHRRLCRRPALEGDPVHHRPKRNAPLSIEEGRLPSPQELLAERVLLAVGERPTMMQWIQRDVRDDYGRVTDRTIYRYVRKFVKQAQLIKLDLGLAFAVYIQPKSRLLNDRDALREYMLANAACIPTSTRGDAA